MRPFALLALTGLLAAAATPAPPAIVSQAFPQRVQLLEQRIATDAFGNRLAPGQGPLLTAQLNAAKAAQARHDPQAGAMLDVIDRELALVDYTLSRAENGQTLAVHVGDKITIAMRDTEGYDVQLDGQALVRAPGVLFVRGVQGVYTASKPGVYPITLTPMGSSSQTPVTFTIVVLAKP